MLRRALLAATIIAIPLSAYAAGMYQGLPSVSAVTPLTGSEMSPADTALPQGQSPQTEVITTQQYRASSYIVNVPVTAFNLASTSMTQLIDLQPAGTLATGTVVLPPIPVDGQRWKLFSSQTITALTISPSTGQTISGTAVTTIAANSSVSYVYQGSTATWFREG